MCKPPNWCKIDLPVWRFNLWQEKKTPHKKLPFGKWYVGQNESAKFWLSILNGLKNRGVGDILIACVDGLSGFPQAIEAVISTDRGAAVYYSSDL